MPLISCAGQLPHPIVTREPTVSVTAHTAPFIPQSTVRIPVGTRLHSRRSVSQLAITWYGVAPLGIAPRLSITVSHNVEAVISKPMTYGKAVS